uniref:LIM zinc-binding domain-containing protein n=1 Tax=Panagrolaimus sp. ES5 TaxID=591445 RepID=A0AC34GN97_9BILA
MAKIVSSTKLLPILEQDEEDLIHSETSSSSSVHSLGSAGEEKSSSFSSSKNPGEKGRLTFVRRMPVIRDYTIDKHGYDYFSNFSKNFHRSSNNNNSSSNSNNVKKTIYQIEKIKLHTDRNCPKFFYTSNRLKSSSSSPPSSSSPLLSSQNFSSSSSTTHQCESRAVYLPYDSIYDKPNNLMKIPINDSSENFATATPYKYLGSEKATVLKIFIAAPKRFIPRDTQEQIIIASPKQQQKQHTEGSSQDSGLENSTPEVSPPGAAQSSLSSRNYWRNESESSLASFTSDKYHLGTTAATTTTLTTKPVLSTSAESMTQKHFVSAKRSLAPSPPTETSAIQQFSSLTLETNPIECNANAKFICRKDYSEAAICKAVVAQGALEETSAKVKAIPMTIRTAQTGGKYSSVRIEVEATRENHAKVAAIKSVSAKEHQKTSGHFKPMCELIDEDLQRRRQSRSPCSLQSSISPASSSKSSDFGADNRSLDRMSFGSGGHLYGNDYKVVALNAKPEPGKLTEFVPEVERNKPSEREEYIVSSYGSANGATRSPPLDAAVVRNWELSDEESPTSKSPVNNNNTEKHVTTTAKIVEHVDTTKYDYPHLGKVFALGKSKDLEYSPDIPTIIIPPYPKSGDKKKRSKSIESNRSAKSVASNKTDSTFASFKSAASKPFSQRSKTSSKGIPAHSDTDSLQSPEPVLVVNTSQVVDSEDEEEPVIHITKKAQEIDEIVVVVNDSSSSIEDVSKENTLKVVRSKPSPYYHPRTTIEVEEETLHYAESQVNVPPSYQEDNDEDDLEEQQYANINTDTLRSNRSLDISEMHNLHPTRPQKIKSIEREDTAEFERYTPSKEPLFYDTVAKYGFDPSGGYHVPKQLYRRDVPIRIEEPRHIPQASNTLPTKPLWNSQPLSRYREEDETKISRVTYRFYDRDMHELSSNTFVDKARRATRSVEDGIEHPIYQLETSYYPQSASADRKFIRSQGYPIPFNANSKNYVKADSKFQILPKTEERPRPKIVKKDLSQHPQQQQHQRHQEQQQKQPNGGSDTRRVYNDSRHPSGAPLPRIDLFSEEPKPLKDKSQSMLTVSGKLRCAHCTCELGRGSAMIIEALGLFYHINCFRCHVCDKMLGTGSQTTDVRVRDGKLHCEKCYSNEDIGVRLSEI